MSHWPTLSAKNSRSPSDRPERPSWLFEGALIHVVNTMPPCVRRVTKVWGPSYEGRAEFDWVNVDDDSWHQGVTIKVGDPMSKDWRLVNEMEVIALQAMDDAEYYAWMKEWYRKQKEQSHGNGTEGHTA
jgi:hypothetical protein